MSSPVDICNDALLELGIPSINELTQGGVVADACAHHYPRARKSVFEDFEWSFATRLSTLQLVSGASDVPTESEWPYAYALPNDFARPVKIDDGLRQPRTDQLLPYKILGHATYKRLLLSTTEDAVLRYVADIEDTSFFPEKFSFAVSMKLAYRLAGPLKGDMQMKAAMRVLYREALEDAIVADSWNEQTEKEPVSQYEDVR